MGRLERRDRRWPGRRRIRPPADRPARAAIEPLLTESRVAVLPAGHPLAGKESISVTDLADEHLLQDPDAVPQWRELATELRGRPPRAQVPIMRAVEEKLEHVAAGHGVVVLPLSTATFYTRPDVVRVPISDIDDNQICLAWDSSRRSPIIRAFVAVAIEHCHETTSA